MLWYLACLDRALTRSETMLASVRLTVAFWARVGEQVGNDRQRKVLNRLLDGFSGNLTAERWARMAGCSKPTAVRDINELIERGVLAKNESGGRSTSYRLAVGDG